MLGWLLRSPISGTVDGSLMLLTVRGRRSGRQIEFPVQYAVGETAVWVYPGHPETKSWWRNLEGGAPVRVHLRGRDLDASAVAIHGENEPGIVEEGLHAFAVRSPRTARSSMGVPVRWGAIDQAALAQAAKRTLLVRVTVPGDALRAARAATQIRGSGATAWIRRHQLASFFLLTYAFSWGWWIPTALAGGHVSHFPGLMGPMFAALVLTPVVLGRAGLRDLRSRLGRWRVPLRWYGAAAAPFGVALATYAALALFGHAPSWASIAWMPGIPAATWIAEFALMTVINGYGEETGWRGFAWPRLRERHTLGGAALILAVPWAVWHIPTIFLDTGMRGFPVFMFPAFFLGMAAGAVVLGWLYEHASSSILIVALWHAFLNMGSATKGAEGVIQAAVTTFVIFWAVDILQRERGRARRALFEAET
jgi:membrane protease YdiL (CAAX protease family)